VVVVLFLGEVKEEEVVPSVGDEQINVSLTALPVDDEILEAECSHGFVKVE
jgi:hypothetical protein